MTTPRRASVVIATRDRPSALATCLASVRASMTDRDDVIVVDSASSDARKVEDVARAGGARYLRLERPGSAAARNLGAAHAQADLLAFIDDDATVEPRWLDALARPFADPHVGAVVGPVLELGRKPLGLLLEFPGFDPLRDAACFDREQDEWFSRVHMGAIGSGTNLAVRRSAFESVGPFRPGLGAGAPIAGDENYFLLTLVENGQRVVNEPAARVHHPAQSPARLLEIAEDRAAYFLYVFLTRPGLRRPCAGLLLSKLSRLWNDDTRDPLRPNLGTTLWAAPAKVFAARRLDRQPSASPS